MWFNDWDWYSQGTLTIYVVDVCCTVWFTLTLESYESDLEKLCLQCHSAASSDI